MTVAQMSSRSRALVATDSVEPSALDHAIQMQAQAKAAAGSIVQGLLDRLQDLASDCTSAAKLESLPAGVREEFRQIGKAVAGRLAAIQMIKIQTRKDS